jgi:glycine cleavage system H protein
VADANIPGDLRYSNEHEWVRVEDDEATVGITYFAQDQLGDVVFIDLPESGTQVKQFAKFGEVESVKSVSDLFAPVSGEVLLRNDAVVDAPEKVNTEPYGEGWLIRVRLADSAELDGLLDAEAYETLTKGAAH